MLRQFTAGAYILSEGRVLLIFHHKIQKWLPPGGHVEPNEMPCETAKREAFEETGIEIEIFSDEHIWIERWNANSFPRPFLCLLEEIPAYKDQPAHQHVDYIYLAKPVGGFENPNLKEVGGLRWFSLDEVELLTNDEEIFEETKKVIRSIFNLVEQKGVICTENPFLLQLQDSMLAKQPCA